MAAPTCSASSAPPTEPPPPHEAAAAPARLRRSDQFRRDLRFTMSLTGRTLGSLGLSAAIALAVWTLAPVAFGYRPNLVTSDSMSPSINTGDVVLTRPVPRRDLRVGQVVLVDHDDRPLPLLHRIRRIEDGEVVTQGDANATPDTASGEVQVLGVGRILVPFVGRPVLFLTSQPGVAAALAAAVVAAGALALRGKRRRDDALPRYLRT